MKIRQYYILATSLLVLAFGCGNRSNNRDGTIHDSMKSFLDNKMISVWYPASIDTLNGGFLSDFKYDWTPSETQHKMVVTQARHLWTLSKLAELYPHRVEYKNFADQGFRFLRDVMWDREHGGFHTLLTPKGRIADTLNYGTEKRTYGNAFAIYALAAYAKQANSQEALKLAQKTFRWLEKHAFDPENNGYFQYLVETGEPFHKVGHVSNAADSIRFPYKDQNTTIHLMEAYAELYRTWPNDTLKYKLRNLLSLVRDTITNEQGTMNLFFYHDWRPLSYGDSIKRQYALDHVSFGHDIETAYLMLDAVQALGRPADQQTLLIAKKMVDHSLTHGMDKKNGGMFQRGYYKDGDVVVIDSTKNWWSQAEAMNTLLLFEDLYPNQGYRQKFDTLWVYVRNNFLDSQYGGWYEKGIDIEPNFRTEKKAHIWKGPYHTFRSLALCLERLNPNDDKE